MFCAQIDRFECIYPGYQLELIEKFGEKYEKWIVQEIIKYGGTPIDLISHSIFHIQTNDTVRWIISANNENALIFIILRKGLASFLSHLNIISSRGTRYIDTA